MGVLRRPAHTGAVAGESVRGTSEVGVTLEIRKPLGLVLEECNPGMPGVRIKLIKAQSETDAAAQRNGVAVNPGDTLTSVNGVDCTYMYINEVRCTVVSLPPLPPLPPHSSPSSLNCTFNSVCACA